LRRDPRRAPAVLQRRRPGLDDGRGLGLRQGGVPDRDQCHRGAAVRRTAAAAPATVLTPPQRRTAAEEAESALLRGIMDGAITPGTPLRLQDLAAQLQMSMMPIREALRNLERLGLVEIVAHRGAWVRPLTREDLLDTYFTRMHLEGIALLEAAKRFDA